jgi:hypothetical protein
MLELFREIPSRGASRFSIVRPATVNLPPIGPKSHQQGIQRTTGGDFVVSGSGSEVGYIYFADRSSLKIRKVLTPVVGSFNHFGGIQVADNILAAGYERFESGAADTSVVLFYDVRNVASPGALDHLTIERTSSGETAGAVGLCRDSTSWLLLVANWDSDRLDFYRSDNVDLFATTTRFALVGTWQFSANGLGAGSVDDRWGTYENINMFADENGTLWFVGMETVFLLPDISSEPLRLGTDVLKSETEVLTSGTGVLKSGTEVLKSGTDLLTPGLDFLKSDSADLYQLTIASDDITVTKRANKRFYRNGEGPRFRYGSGFRLNSITGKFEVYSCEANLSNLGRVNRCNRWG